VYVLALLLLSEVASFATLGLIQPWGKRFPRWMPFVGGRRVSVRFAVTTATLGAMSVLLYTAGYFYLPRLCPRIRSRPHEHAPEARFNDEYQIEGEPSDDREARTPGHCPYSRPTR
jgi:hypothetical protein